MDTRQSDGCLLCGCTSSKSTIQELDGALTARGLEGSFTSRPFESTSNLSRTGFPLPPPLLFPSRPSCSPLFPLIQSHTSPLLAIRHPVCLQAQLNPTSLPSVIPPRPHSPHPPLLLNRTPTGWQSERSGRSTVALSPSPLAKRCACVCMLEHVLSERERERVWGVFVHGRGERGRGKYQHSCQQ